MKPNLFYTTFLLLIMGTAVFAQEVTGSWQGSIPTAAINLRLVFNIKKTDAGYSATFDSPDQNAYGIACSKVTFEGDSLFIEIAIIKGGYKGKWDKKDGIAGVYSQNGGSRPMDLKRIDPLANVKPKEVLKPQTPRPPLNYYSQDVEYDNADKSLHYGATFTRPNGSGRYPAVIIISGSGTQDRNGSMFGHEFYNVLADYLSRNGIAVLRVDDRGAGKSTLGADIMTATSRTFSYDVENSLNYLESRNDVNVKHIGLIGHSEGAIIAPMLAARRNDVAFVVLWGCPAIGGAQTSTMQGGFALKMQGVDANAISAFNTLQLKIFGVIAECKTIDEFNNKVDLIFTDWKKQQTPAVLEALKINVDVKAVQKNYASVYSSAWTRYFMTYDPLTDLRKVKCPVLAIIGSKDTQVDAARNLPLIKATLTKSGNTDVETVAMPNLNHFLQTADKGDISEVGPSNETISPAALKTITDWINMHTK